MVDSLDDILAAIWQAWSAATEDAQHPYRTGAFATRTKQGVAQRTVILRQADRKSGVLVFYTDRRSAKVAELMSHDRVGWICYDPATKTQIRTEGTCVCHIDGPRVEQAWQSLPPVGRRNYLGLLPPGSVMDGPASNLPKETPPPVTMHSPVAAESDERLPPSDSNDRPDLEAGRRNFAMLTLHVDAIDWLWLREQGHLRCRFVRSAPAENWLGDWLAP